MATTAAPIILWFRRDLRLNDNPALRHAVESGRPVLPVYILDPAGDGRPRGAASLWWLDKSLRALAADLERRGSRLVFRRGDSEEVLRGLVGETGARCVLMNRLFEPPAWARDTEIARALQAEGVEVKGYNGTLLCRPGGVMTGSGGPYKVFTPFLRSLLQGAVAPEPWRAPDRLPPAPSAASERIDDWKLHPTRPDWSTGFDWTPGEAGAEARLGAFIQTALDGYGVGRDRPARPTSRLSPHLHWGEISPWRAFLAARDAASAGQVPGGEADKFIAELGWRDFSAHIFHHFPHLADTAFRPEYDQMPWRNDPAEIEAWKRGRTGYPLVDAGLRQLWTTGWMQNRVRMVVASFLIKHLMVDWRIGEAWFWDTLVDADWASNAGNWQWVAGSGVDAAPYFRIFNPIAQGQKFDADGAYVRRWIPELARLPDRWLHAPWTAPSGVLADAGVRLDDTYPRPIVEHEFARKRALDALKSISGKASPVDA